MFVTFLAGTGIDQADGGSVGVFDPQTNKVIKIIQARKSKVGKGKPYIMYPHGISAYGDRMVVTSTVHADLATGVGNGITVIDLNKLEPIQNIVTEDAKPVGFPSSPVEVLFVRPEISPRAKPGVLVNTMFGFEVWKIPYNEADKSFGTPAKVYDGATRAPGSRSSSTATRRNFHQPCHPRCRQALQARQPAGPRSVGSDIKTEPGAHHIIFYETRVGTESRGGAEQPAEPRQQGGQRSDRRRLHREGECALDHRERPRHR